VAKKVNNTNSVDKITNPIVEEEVALLEMVSKSSKFSKTEFYKELESSLSTSNGEQRKKWATTIIQKNLDLKKLSELLKCEHKTASRFLWLLSDIGILNPKTLLAELPFLYHQCERLHPAYRTSFASFWLYVGVPHENEGQAIDLLFQLLRSDETTVTIKSRALSVLFSLTKKYPDLKNELRMCLAGLMDKHSKAFKKRASKILAAMGES
jgi:hypothetical protein